jgi:hypothetical protein
LKSPLKPLETYIVGGDFMVRVSCRYNQAFADFLKTVGGRWDPELRTWEVPDDRILEVEAKAKDLGVQNLRIELTSPAVKAPVKAPPAAPPEAPPEVKSEAPSEAPSESPARRGEGVIRMRLSRDGRFVLISMDLLAFAEDVKALMEGKRGSVRFRILSRNQ